MEYSFRFNSAHQDLAYFDAQTNEAIAVRGALTGCEPIPANGSRRTR